MTYAYDDYVQMPTKDLYDTAVMKMAIEAAKDMYDKGQSQMENFYKTYGDFMSPFAKDMQWYGGEMNRIRSTIDDAYARGIDLFKSPEGRMLVSQLTHSIDPMQYNMAKANAKMGYAYLEALQEAKRNGTYDPAYENWMLNQEGGPGSFEDFSTAQKGMWTVSGPSKYQDANTLVSPLFENMKDEYIEEIDGYDYSGVSRDRRELVLQANLGALLKTPNGRYLYELSKEKAEQQLNRTPTEEETLKQYIKDLLDASDRFGHRTRTENKDWARQRESQLRMKEDDHRSKNDEKVYREKAAIDYDYKTLDMYDTDRDKKISETESKRINGNNADPKANKNVYQRTDTNNGGLTVFEPSDDIKEKVTPLYGNIRRQAYKIKESDSSMVMYSIPNDLIPRTLFKQAGDKLIPMEESETKAIIKHTFGKDTFEITPSSNFISTGKMFSKKDENGNVHYYITGYVSYGKKKDNSSGTVDCVMEVSRPTN